jgi:hypothetical protein
MHNPSADPLPGPTTALAPLPGPRLLTAAESHLFADLLPEVEWFANISNPNTGRAYENAIRDFMCFTGIARPEDFRVVTRAPIIAWAMTSCCVPSAGRPSGTAFPPSPRCSHSMREEGRHSQPG